MKKYINKRDIKLVGITLVAGLFFGWLFFHSSGNEATHKHEEHTQAEETIWTCSMHPQIKQNKPGKCPICSMDLVPMEKGSVEGEHVDPNEIQMTESALALASVQTTVVMRGVPKKNVQLLGKVKADERKISELTARFGGRIEKLLINYTGQQVNKGQKLGTIYSPELITAQKELLEAVKYKSSNPSFYKAARTKLKLWDLTEEQIDAIENNGEPKTYFEILSPIAGTVTKRHVAIGDYVKEGSALFEVIDLSEVWIMFDAYESDLPWVRKGDNINFTIQSVPGETFNGKISYIDPFIDAQTRVAQVRVELNNPKQQLKPEMFANGILKSNITENTNELLIPKSSILWTGKRAVVYVKVPGRETASFIYREITLGAEAGNFYVVINGLSEGEEIATNGVFKIDAAAQLEGKPSMMNPDGGQVMSGHNHGGMDMGGSTSQKDEEKKTKTVASKSLTVDKQAKEALQPLYDSYLRWKDALTTDDFAQAQKAASNMKSALDKVNMGLFTGDAHTTWMDYQGGMRKSLEHVHHFSDIEQLRKAFQTVSAALIEMTNTFTPLDKTIYVQHCPMADNNNGADWLSTEKQIKNPYFGSSMLTCGEVTKEIK